MGEFLLDVFKVFLFSLLLGVFSGSEMALVSFRKTRVKELVKQGNKAAKVIENLQNNPERFIAVAQIGVSVVTIMASVFAESRLQGYLKPWIAESGIVWLVGGADFISYLLIIVMVAYLSMVFGELVPKSLALRYSEPFALMIAYPFYWLSRISGWLVKILTFSSNVVLKPFKDSTSFSESKLSEEEIRNVILEGRKAGTIERKEHEFLENVFEFADLSVGKIMRPVAQVTAFDIDDPVNLNIKKVIESRYSRVPFYKEKLDNIIGILNVKDLNIELGGKTEIDLRSLLRPAIFVPNSQKIMSVLQKFQKNKTHLAIVTDEHGGVDGIVTLEDILEEIVGEISDEKDEIKREIRKNDDGSFDVEGGTSIVDFNRYFKTHIPEDENYSTISGLILDELERFPDNDDVVEAFGVTFKVKEKTNRAVKILEVRVKNVVEEK